MSRLPQLELALVEAAARGRVRRRPPLRALAAVAALACVAVALALVQRPAGEREAVAVPPPATLSLSHALAAAPAPDTTRVDVPHAQLPAVAAEFEAQTPYPPGTHEDFNWLATSADPASMSSINARSDVQFLVEYRAQCRWLSYWLATRSAGALAVLRDVPEWPALRRDADGQLRKNADAAAAGDVAAVQTQVSLNCRL